MANKILRMAFVSDIRVPTADVEVTEDVAHQFYIDFVSGNLGDLAEIVGVGGQKIAIADPHSTIAVLMVVDMPQQPGNVVVPPRGPIIPHA